MQLFPDPCFICVNPWLNKMLPDPNIDLTVRGLNWPLARLCAELSAQAYSVVPDVRDGDTDTSVLIREYPEFVIVAVKGTNSLKDFVLDAEAWMAPIYFGNGKEGLVHQGFRDAFKGVVMNVDVAIARIGKPVVFTGHSLGGAIAKLLSWYHLRVGGQLHSLYTFGQPRVGDKRFAQHCEELFGNRHFRFVDELDVVTRLPGLLLGFRHSGYCEFLEGDEVIEDPVLLTRLFLDAIKIWTLRKSGPIRFALGVTQLIEDHKMEKYIRKLGVVGTRTPENNS